jgi:hypothetical protein
MAGPILMPPQHLHITVLYDTGTKSSAFQHIICPEAILAIAEVTHHARPSDRVG